jgi:hypothetical protein
METREQRIRREASALWRAMFDEPPPPEDDGGALLEKLVQRGDPQRYGRLHLAHLSDPSLAWPRDERSSRR